VSPSGLVSAVELMSVPEISMASASPAADDWACATVQSQSVACALAGMKHATATRNRRGTTKGSGRSNDPCRSSPQMRPDVAVMKEATKAVAEGGVVKFDIEHRVRRSTAATRHRRGEDLQAQQGRMI
jgi:hypothetical protein